MNTQFMFPSGAIHNPNEIQHFMVVKPLSRRVRVLLNDLVLAETTDAIRLMETWKNAYDPALYLPLDALIGNLSLNTKTTHCPLKGDARYFDLHDDKADIIVENIAWTYKSSFDFAYSIKHRVSFYSTLVTIEEAPL